MPDLATFQKRFAAALQAPPDAAGFPDPGFAVYRNTSADGLLQALRDGYPTVRLLLGGAMLDTLALSFAHLYPPSTPILAGYGEGFAEFIEDGPLAAQLPYLADVARLDRLHTDSHLAADAPALTLRDMAGPHDWARLRLPLHPATRFAWLATPAMTIWLAHRDGAAEALEPEWQAEGALFTRADGAVAARLIGRAEHHLLFGVRIGKPLGVAAAAVVRLYPGVDIAALLARLIADGALSALNEEKMT